MADDLERRSIRSGARWEPVAGYSRAIRLGRFIAVSGSAAVDAEGGSVEHAADSTFGG